MLSSHFNYEVANADKFNGHMVRLIRGMSSQDSSVGRGRRSFLARSSFSSSQTNVHCAASVSGEHLPLGGARCSVQSVQSPVPVPGRERVSASSVQRGLIIVNCMID